MYNVLEVDGMDNKQTKDEQKKTSVQKKLKQQHTNMWIDWIEERK